ncbi:MAG TPA: peptidoglycan editing factor PgeF [Burkholderiaceae bacterium]|nr:peptidoglycan editing factor PgeF [Burkholderiaceae bacterium]
MRDDWLVPAWPAPANVRAVCTTRSGGQSLAPYDGLNLGDHVGDAPAAVAANRQQLQEAIGTRPVFLRQVHGRAVAGLGPSSGDGIEADACMTAAPGVACTIMVADCLPVLLTDLGGTAVAAAHAGWRGLAGGREGGVLEAVHQQLCDSMRADRTQSTAELIAWLGPCIGPQAFEVGPEVRAEFLAHDPAAAAMFREHGNGKWLADLQGLARQRLQALGVTRIHGNDGGRDWCTVANPSRFFSHRRDSGVLGGSGRFAACVWLDPVR